MCYYSHLTYGLSVCSHLVCVDGLAAYSMYENFRRDYEEQTTKMCLLETTPWTHTVEQRTLPAWMCASFFFSNYMHSVSVGKTADDLLTWQPIRHNHLRKINRSS